MDLQHFDLVSEWKDLNNYKIENESKKSKQQKFL